jgi:hypothetical protein
MTKIKYIAAVLVALASVGLQQVQADLGPVTFFTVPQPIGSPADDTAYLINNFGQQSDLVSLYKLNNDGTTDPNLPLNSSGDFKITMTSGNTWMVSWNLTGSGYMLESLLIKDGGVRNKQLYGFYPVINNEGTTGSGTVSFVGETLILPTPRNISFVEFFGSPVPTHVPDGGSTAILLGAGLSGLGFLRRLVKR